MAEIDLMEKYPRTKRNVAQRGEEKTPEDVAVARQFGREFFDGERRHGYGGYSYNPKYWTSVIPIFIKHYRLAGKSKILDVGCGKGFMLHDFMQALPGLTVRGLDISSYAIQNAMEPVQPFVSVGNAKDLGEFKNGEFDLVLSINTVHNLEREECKKALSEIQRVGKNGFIIVDAWRNEEEKKRMIQWNLTAKTYMHVEDWKKFFNEAGYKGDYYWFFPE